jgi:hypothetical protein
MALNLAITQPSGVAVSYWKVSRMHIDNINCTISAEVAGYLNYSAYLSGSSYMAIMLEVMGPTQYEAILTSTNMISAFYTALSQMPDFIGSTIVA